MLIRLKGVIAADAVIRTAEFDGVQYTVAPVVAIKPNMVWYPIGGNSKGDFVSSEVLAASVTLWNNRPVVMGHPVVDGNNVSANTPTVLETYRFGHIFTPTFDTTVGLKLEAYFNDDMAKAVGDEAVDTLARIRAKDPVEISVGMEVLGEEIDGIFNGERYGFEYLVIFPDHLAMLPRGTTGACSIAKGCGAPRVASDGTSSSRVLRVARVNCKENVKETPMSFSPGLLLRRAKLEVRKVQRRLDDESDDSKAAQRQAELNGELSDRDYRRILETVIYETIPQDPWVLEFYRDQLIVRYETWSRYGSDSIWEHDYTFDEATKTATLTGEPRKLEYSSEYKAVPAAVTATKTTKEDEPMPVSETITALVNDLVACKCTPFEEGSRAALELLPEKELQAMKDQFNPPVVSVTGTPVASETPTLPVAAATPVIAPVEDTATPGTVTMTAEQHQSLMDSIAESKGVVAVYKAEIETRRASLCTLLTTHDPVNLAAEHLTDKAVPELERLVASHGLNKPVGVNVGAVNYGVTPAAPVDTNRKPRVIPTPITSAIEARNKVAAG